MIQLDTLKSAIRNNDKSTIKHIDWSDNWIYENMCDYAAEHNNLKYLKLAHENECIWTFKTLEKIISNGHIACFDYAISNGCPREIIKHKRIYNFHPIDLFALKVTIDGYMKI